VIASVRLVQVFTHVRCGGHLPARSDGERITAHPTHKSLGHDEDLNLVLPARGSWTIQLQVQVDDLNSDGTSQRFVVR
jgi:hypothetical protein